VSARDPRFSQGLPDWEHQRAVALMQSAMTAHASRRRWRAVAIAASATLLGSVIGNVYQRAARDDAERLRTIAHGAIVALCQESPEHDLCQPPAGAHGWCEHDWQELAPLYCD
jgi:hypothetical protein